jgi:S-adenosylmethionine:tRNA ribosyltransferase-isomerase
VLRRGDIVVANDAATMPAGRQGTMSRQEHRSRCVLRPLGRSTARDEARFAAIVFGAGDHRRAPKIGRFRRRS